MNRRNFIQTTGFSLASILISKSVMGGTAYQNNSFIHFPDEVKALSNGKPIPLQSSDQQTWSSPEVSTVFKKNTNSLGVEVQAPSVLLEEIQIRWNIPSKPGSVVLNDHWERTYGDISWHRPDAAEILPWYFMESDGKTSSGFGVKTGAHSFCSWRVFDDHLLLVMDTRSGGRGVQLKERKLKAAEIVAIKNEQEESVYQTSLKFMKLMCEKPHLPKQPVYGINDWYFTYGNTSEKLILEHTQLIAPLAEGIDNKPFSMIDSGWFKGSSWAPDDCCWGNDMASPDQNFPDMHKLAGKINDLGMRAGIWTRPLCGSEHASSNLMLPVINGREKNKPVLDPTIPENLEKIAGYIRLYKEWGFEMVKFDFTTYDLLGRWGFEMMKEKSMTSQDWSFYNPSLTNAEIILQLYNTIREAAGETYIISCNTVSHLSAGLFELNRIGDDTSGNEWGRTRRMGVNTLAFRGMQHNIFYEADADCVGLTTKVPWEKNKQWMELLAKSGTPLFISAQPDATGQKQKEFIRECFQLAAKPQPLPEPLDWMETPLPLKWKLQGKTSTFNWD